MANDLLIIRCKCGQCATLYKYYPSGGYSRDLTTWIEMHLGKCVFDGKPLEVFPDIGDCPFEIHTESSVSTKYGKITKHWFDDINEINHEPPP